MKTIKLSFLLTVVALTVNAQGNYEQTMSNAITGIYQADSPEKYDQLANQFNRIAQVETDKWEPSYYEALAYVFKSWTIEVPSEKDGILDQAHVALNKATQVDGNNSEIVALQGFVDMMKLTADPATRGQVLTPKIMATFGRAMAIDPANPRATLFMAQMQIGTAQFFGTPIDEPCALVDRAEELFKNAKPKSALAPMWGKQSVAQYKKMCAESVSGQ